MKTKALILDRDGTLIEHVPYLNKIADIKLLPDVREALSLALNAGMLLFCTLISRVLVAACFHWSRYRSAMNTCYKS